MDKFILNILKKNRKEWIVQKQNHLIFSVSFVKIPANNLGANIENPQKQNLNKKIKVIHH